VKRTDYFGKPRRVAEDITIGNPDCFVSEFHQVPVSFCVPLYVIRFTMHPAIQLDNEADFRTVKIDNVAINRNLSSKLQAKHSPIS